MLIAAMGRVVGYGKALRKTDTARSVAVDVPAELVLPTKWH